jgi:hypothetical protein
VPDSRSGNSCLPNGIRISGAQTVRNPIESREQIKHHIKLELEARFGIKERKVKGMKDKGESLLMLLPMDLTSDDGE